MDVYWGKNDSEAYLRHCWLSHKFVHTSFGSISLLFTIIEI